MFPYLIAVGTPALFLIALAFLPNGVWKVGQTLKANPAVKDKAEAARQSEVSSIANGLASIIRDHGPTFDGSYQAEKIYRAIQYVIARHDWYETQRTVILGYVLTISGLVFAGMAAYLATQKGTIPESAKLVIAGTGGTLLLGIFSIVVLYNKELDQDRPYRLIADIRHWFFRYSLRERTADYQGRLDVENIADDVLAEKQRFFDRVMEVSSLEESIREDLEQLFILHVLVKHKSESLQKMRSTFTFLVIFLTGSTALFFTYYAFFA